MDEKASSDEPLPNPAEADGVTVDAPSAEALFVPGTEVGGRYRIYSRLGAGGMGEVWHAFDLKLRVDVALKAIRPDLLVNQRRRELLRQEVRAAREVMSPNVCRIFDLIEADGRELVSMEYIDGATLLGVLQERGPLELKEAQDIASQFLSGLEAIHKAGLVHRDVKPENIMLTRAGRVVVMDFGLARGPKSGAGSISGTPAYMAPEHAAGQDVDSRADVYSAGVVLAEMVSPEGISSYESRHSVWEGVRSEPSQVPDSPWAPVIQRAVALDRDHRQNSAHTLIRELEEVTLRVEGADDLHPYPGLASFTEEDAEYFFGREAEIEAFWINLDRPQLLAIVGPSGAGKSSFIRAGVLPAAPADWHSVVCTPGNAAIASLARPMARELAGDAELVEKLLAFDDSEVAVEIYSSWRQKHTQAMLVVDQFEELFTLNPPEIQSRFARLLSRLVLEADVCVVLSMRDDFLLRCRDQEPLKPIFSELTALPTLTGTALRRALVQPATSCGYRFEDNRLVDEMLSDVEGERGALPMLAFAAARLWEKRDRENGLLTRQAYQEIGGVGGALAQHAESTIDRIGADRVPVVRELFRNLVTAEGTRAVREWTELSSVFSDSSDDSPEEVLRELIDARLLTSYETREGVEEPTRMVEIIHESLLANWPRLVRWRTQDEEGAQLRDELRQAARTWDEHGRPDGRLWTGSAYREFRLWQERYPGGLSETEESFGQAMTLLATRRRRRRRLVATISFASLLIVLAVVGTLWQRSVRETRRAEAAKLVALGEVELESFPTASLAWATASLELADSIEGRLLALRALQLGPPVTSCPLDSDGGFGTGGFGLSISPSGTWIASGWRMLKLRNQDGGEPDVIGHPPSDTPIQVGFATDEVLITGDRGLHRWWSIPHVDRPAQVREDRGWLRNVGKDGYFSLSEAGDEVLINRWLVDGGPGRVVGGMKPWIWEAVDPAGSMMAYARDTIVYVRSLSEWDRDPLEIGEHDRDIHRVVFHPSNEQVATADASGMIKVWSTTGDSRRAIQTFDLGGTPCGELAIDPNGRWLAGYGDRTGLHLFDLNAPQGTVALTLRRSDEGVLNAIKFHPAGSWLVTGNNMSLGFWPLTHHYPLVLDHNGGRVSNVAFSPDAGWLVTVTAWEQGSQTKGRVRAWPLKGQNDNQPRALLERPHGAFDWAGLDIHPSGKLVAVSSQEGLIYVLPLEGGPPLELHGLSISQRNHLVAFSPDGRHLASVPRFAQPDGMVIRLWNLDSGDERNVGAVEGSSVYLNFIDDRRLRWVGNNLETDGASGGERIFDLESGSVEIKSTGGTDLSRSVSSGGEFFVATELVGGSRARPDSELRYVNTLTGETTRITSHGRSPDTIAFDPTKQWMVTAGGYHDHVVRVGPVTGEEPHLLFGHENRILAVEISPDGRWIASTSYDGTVRLWPMPDMLKPPLHTLPHDELLAKLETLTNFRVVRDEDSTTGWKLEVGPFPGWATVPEW